MEQDWIILRIYRFLCRLRNLIFVLLTHMHISITPETSGSVCGRLPGKYLYDICHGRSVRSALRDSAHIQMFEAEWRNRKGRRSGKEPVQPLYDMNDAQGNLLIWWDAHISRSRNWLLTGFRYGSWMPVTC